MKWKLIIPLILVLAVHSPLSQGTTSFCQAPLQYTCNENLSAALAREKKIERIELELKNQAFKETLAFINDPSIKEQLGSFEDIDSLTPKRKRVSVEKIFYARLHLAFANYLKKNGVPADLNFNVIKESLHRAINNTKELSAESKTEFHGILQEIRLVSFHSDVEDNSLSDIHSLYKLCAKNTFLDNAFATEIGDEKVVILCPGELIGTIEYSLENKFKKEQILLPLVMTLGHELSHHFDSRIYPDAYTFVLNELEREKLKLKGDPSDYLSESVADMWGLKATKILIEKTTDEKFLSRLMAGSLDDLCGTEDDGEHPSGEFRINELSAKILCN